MFSVVIQIRKPRDLGKFEEHFWRTHLPLVRAIPGVRKVIVHRIVEAHGGDQNLWALVDLNCEDLATFQKAMASPEAKCALQDGLNLESNAGTTMSFDYYCETTEL
jgi:uncharacterized protein (TIGR02118 family)